MAITLSFVYLNPWQNAIFPEGHPSSIVAIAVFTAVFGMGTGVFLQTNHQGISYVSLEYLIMLN
jgi:hypothetical protein